MLLHIPTDEVTHLHYTHPERKLSFPVCLVVSLTAAGGRAGGLANGQACRQTDKQADIQAGTQVGRQASRQAGRRSSSLDAGKSRSSAFSMRTCRCSSCERCYIAASRVTRPFSDRVTARRAPRSTMTGHAVIGAGRRMLPGVCPMDVQQPIRLCPLGGGGGDGGVYMTHLLCIAVQRYQSNACQKNRTYARRVVAFSPTPSNPHSSFPPPRPPLATPLPIIPLFEPTTCQSVVGIGAYAFPRMGL